LRLSFDKRLFEISSSNLFEINYYSLVEMMGIEPMSKIVPLKQTTSLVYLKFFNWKAKNKRKTFQFISDLFLQKLFGKKQEVLS